MEKCKNCGQQVQQINYALGPKWIHIPQGNPSEHDWYRHCRLVSAEPEPEFLMLAGDEFEAEEWCAHVETEPRVYVIVVDPKFDSRRHWACEGCLSSHIHRLSARGPLRVERAKRF